METERRKGVECCWCGSAPAAEGTAQIFGFALRACISEGVLYMNCMYGSHFQHDRFDTLSFGEQVLRIRLFENKSVSTDLEQH
jgi:hypothetical protein